jgi:phosphate acetyltransferase
MNACSSSPSSAQADRGSADLDADFARSLLDLDVPDPMPFAAAEARVRAGGLDALLEDLVAAVEIAATGCDVVVVEGLIPDAGLQIATRLNAAMARAFAATLIPVLSGKGDDPAALAAIVDLAYAPVCRRRCGPTAGWRAG